MKLTPGKTDTGLSTGDMTSGVIRQRRNLLICCVVLLAIKITGARFSELPIAGGKLEQIDHVKLLLLIWAVCFYFAYRFWVYVLNDDGYKKIFSQLRINIEKDCFSRIRKKFGEKLNIYAAVEKKIKPIDDIDSWWQLNRSSLKIKPDNAKEFNEDFKSRFSSYEIEYSIKGKCHTGEIDIHGRINFSYFELWKTLFVSWKPILFNKIDFSNYLLPFVLFGITMLTYFGYWVVDIFPALQKLSLVQVEPYYPVILLWAAPFYIYYFFRRYGGK